MPSGRLKLAVVGLGAMGYPIACRLAQSQNVELILHDAEPARLARASELGLAARSVTEAAALAEVVFTILPADRQVEAVAAEVAESARPGLWLADFSTIAPATMARVAARLRAAGMGALSVAITRGTAAAQRGELALFLGAEQQVPPDVEAVLKVLAAEIRPASTLSAAKALKIANNMVLSCIDVALCEALVLTQSRGLRSETLVEALSAAGADSWALRNHIVQNVLTGDLGVGHFSVRNMLKDVELYIDLAAPQRVPALLPSVAAAYYRALISAGLGDHYHPVIVRWIAQSAGLKFRPEAGERRSGPDLEHLVAGVAALQGLVSEQALDVLRGFGIDTREAAGHLGSGSADNTQLAAAARQPADGSSRGRTDALSSVRALMHESGIPAFFFEVAGQ